MDEGERYLYLEEVRQRAIDVAIHAKSLQGFPTPRTQSGRDLEDEMAKRFAAHVVHLQDDAAVMPRRGVSLWRRLLRRLAVYLWKVATAGP